MQMERHREGERQGCVVFTSARASTLEHLTSCFLPPGAHWSCLSAMDVSASPRQKKDIRYLSPKLSYRYANLCDKDVPRSIIYDREMLETPGTPWSC